MVLNGYAIYSLIPLIIAYVIFSYLVIRNYFAKNISSNYALLNKKLTLIMIVAGIISILSLSRIHFIYDRNQKTFEFLNFLFMFKSDVKYQFRIAALILLILFIGSMIFLYIKNKYLLTILCMGVGIVANVMSYIDFVNFDWSKLTNKSFELFSVGIAFFIIYLVIYLFLIIRNYKIKQKQKV